MSVVLDTSHSPIGPCELSEQSPFGDCSRHASTALLSSALDCSEIAGVVFLWIVRCGLKVLKGVEQTGVHAIIGKGQVEESGTLVEMCCCARTTARIGQHADKKYEEQHPEKWRQTNLCLLVQCFVSVSVPLCACLCISVYVFANI